MGLFSKLGVVVLLVALFIGALYSGGFQYMDQYQGSRGQFFKGLVPPMHTSTPWGFSEAQIPDLDGNVIVVTGANSGLGFWTARHMAANKATVVLTCRSQPRCEAAVTEIKASVGSDKEVNLVPMVLDLASFGSVRAFAAAFRARFDRLDSLVLNAGVMVPPFSKTAEGLELQIGTNHFGHFLLTSLLLPVMTNTTQKQQNTPPSTIVAVASAAHFDSYPEGIRSFEDMNNEDLYDRRLSYGQSKLANVLFAQELAERLKDKNILVNSVHPGAVETDLVRHVLNSIGAVAGETIRGFVEKHVLPHTLGKALWRPRDASLTQLFAAVSPKLRAQRTTGKYYHPIARLTTPDPHCQNRTLQRMLWEMSEMVIGQT